MRHSTNLSTPDAVAMLMRRIESGRFRPGERIFAKEMAQEFGGSPIPVREALCQLVGRGIVVEQRNKGFRIAPMTSTVLRSLYAAHGRLMEGALQRWQEMTLLQGRARAPWPAFAAIVRHANDDVLSGLQQYLAGRLAIARKFERAWFETQGMDYPTTETMRKGDPAVIGALIRDFHQECQRSAPQIWQLLSDR